jgi:NAD(P)-dependent dehydrogenase (short-subunit alcohol dehydrogenase family)
MKDLRAKVAVITGAASGIGAAMARSFVLEGMKVVLADIEGEALNKTTDELRKTGADVLAVQADVSNGGDVESLAAKSLGHFGCVHVICNNAGVGAPPGPLWERTLSDWQWVLGVNLWGVIHGIRVFTPLMIAQGEGHVVNTASMAGLCGNPLLGIYDASKHAVMAISEALHFELAMRNSPVKVSVLCPGPLPTRIHESERNRPLTLANSQSSARSDDPPPLTAPALPESHTTVDLASVADRVVRAIRQEQLYVITHPELKPLIRNRMEAIIAERNPGGIDSRESRIRRLRDLKEKSTGAVSERAPLNDMQIHSAPEDNNV